jgi:hypothetical protein
MNSLEAIQAFVTLGFMSREEHPTTRTNKHKSNIFILKFLFLSIHYKARMHVMENKDKKKSRKKQLS